MHDTPVTWEGADDGIATRSIRSSEFELDLIPSVDERGAPENEIILRNIVLFRCLGVESELVGELSNLLQDFGAQSTALWIW